MIHCQRCQNEIPDEDCLRRAAELGWIHPEEIQAALDKAIEARIEARNKKSTRKKKSNGIQNP